MNSIWNKNISLLKERFPELYFLLQKDLEKGLPQKNDFQQSESFPIEFPCGWQVSYAKNKEFTATEQGVGIHSSYNPSQEAKKLAASFFQEKKIGKKNVFVFLGFGLGYGPCALATELTENNVLKDAILVLIEPNPTCFAASLCCLDFSKVFSVPNCVIIVGASSSTVIPVLEHYGLSNCNFIRNKASLQSKKYFDEVETLVQRNISKSQINNKTLEKFAGLWQKNSCKNLNFLAELDGVKRYEKMANGLPACVLAAGPSLDQVIPYLKEIKKRSILICVDTALKSCLREGVEPDFILLVDPQYWNTRHIAGLSSPSSVMITELAAYPSVFRFNCREIILCSSLYPIGKYFENICGKKGQLGAGGSVATTAWDFARFCGCNEIFMAGLDLGFPFKRTHSKGCFFEERTHKMSNRLNPAESANVGYLFGADIAISKDYLGNPLVTDNRMSMYAWWFESKVASFPGQPTFSFTHNSLSIPGIKPYSLQDFLLRPEENEKRHNFFEAEKKSKTNFVSEAESRKINFSKALTSILDDFSQMYEVAKKGQNLCQKVLKAQGKITFESLYSEIIPQLDKIDKSIMSSASAEVISLVFPTEQQLEKIISAQPSPNNPKAESIYKTKVIYSELMKGIKGYLSLLSE